MKDVCVIGAGVAGLVAARHLHEKFCVTVYEASSSIGGIWLYNKGMEGIKHTPMYKNLRTNLPKQLMSFRDLPYEEDMPTFLTHEQVMTYLDRYCEKFSIRNFIEFNTPVTSVKPDTSCDPVKWIVNTPKGSKIYDGVAVCSGPFHSPRYPDNIDLKNYSGRVYHSCTYSDPSDFAEHDSILVIGAGNSGIDISLELWATGKKIFLVHRKPEDLQGFPQNLAQIRKTIKRVNETEIEFCDGSSIFSDAILLCTGYTTDVSFLDKSCGISVKGGTTLYPLYKYMINPAFPSMAFMDRLLLITPFLLTEYQAMFFSQTLDNSIQLPSQKERLEEANELLNRAKGRSDKRLYSVTDHMDYYQDLGNLTGEHLIDYELGAALHNNVLQSRHSQPLMYRKYPKSHWEKLD